MTELGRKFFDQKELDSIVNFLDSNLFTDLFGVNFAFKLDKELMDPYKLYGIKQYPFSTPLPESTWGNYYLIPTKNSMSKNRKMYIELDFGIYKVSNHGNKLFLLIGNEEERDLCYFHKYLILASGYNNMKYHYFITRPIIKEVSHYITKEKLDLLNAHTTYQSTFLDKEGKIDFTDNVKHLLNPRKVDKNNICTIFKGLGAFVSSNNLERLYDYTKAIIDEIKFLKDDNLSCLDKNDLLYFRENIMKESK